MAIPPSPFDLAYAALLPALSGSSYPIHIPLLPSSSGIAYAYSPNFLVGSVTLRSEPARLTVEVETLEHISGYVRKPGFLE